MEFDARFHWISNRGTRAGSESSIRRREQDANFAGFVKRHQIVLPCEFTPHLKVHEVI
jgi:hypothetical protein